MVFRFEHLSLLGVILIRPDILTDSRGFFLETYEYETFKKAGISDTFVQNNYSHSLKGVLRGLHYQNPPFAQSKLVRVLKGTILDVAVDIRKKSGTYGKYVAKQLSDREMEMLYIPEGFAHGFFVLSDCADVDYKISRPYNQNAEAGIIWNDPTIKIKWPVEEPILSERDRKWPALENAINLFD